MGVGMGTDAVRPSRRQSAIWMARINAVIGPLMIGWLGLTVAVIVYEQIAMLPLPPPTPAQLEAATPGARADWAVVYAQLHRRIPRPPPELGRVWATRSGRICGYVNSREAGVDFMTPFFTVGRRPVLREDDEHLYFREWLSCLGDYWVDLHAGTEDTGFCASRHGRSSVLGELLCDRKPPPRSLVR